MGCVGADEVAVDSAEDPGCPQAANSPTMSRKTIKRDMDISQFGQIGVALAKLIAVGFTSQHGELASPHFIERRDYHFSSNGSLSTDKALCSSADTPSQPVKLNDVMLSSNTCVEPAS